MKTRLSNRMIRVRLFTAAFVLWLLATAAARAEVNPQEQLFIYELNRARNDPVRYQMENSSIVTDDLSSVAPQPPLAISSNLSASAAFKSQEMASSNYCAHTSAVTGIMPNELARSFGYPLPGNYVNDANNIESIFCQFGSSPSFTNTLAQTALANLIQDEGVPSLGHRIHLFSMNDFFAMNREIGVGARTAFAGGFTQGRVAVHTAQVDPSDKFLTGVVYNDANGNGRYDLNEGLGGVTVANSAGPVLTGPAGGWAMQVASGTHTVTASGGAFSGTASATVSNVMQNTEIDFISGNPQGEVNFANQIAHANLSVTKTAAPSPVQVGANLTYTVVVRNNGPSGASGVSMTDVLPGGVTFVSAISTRGSCTQSAGIVTCDIGTLANGASATQTIIVTPTMTNQICNSASVAANEEDLILTNNNAVACVTVIPAVHDFAVTQLKAPKKVTLKTGVPPKPGKVQISIQNLSPHTETIANLATLQNLVTLDITSLGGCPVPAKMLVPPKLLPVVLAPNKKLKLTYLVTIDCANDPLPNTKTDLGHEDYVFTVHVDHAVLDPDQIGDTNPPNDDCPRGPAGADKGCGNKTASGALGGDVITDVAVK